VCILGVKSARQLNGLSGKILDRDPVSGRWQVDLGIHGIKAFNTSNLVPVPTRVGGVAGSGTGPSEDRTADAQARNGEERHAEGNPGSGMPSPAHAAHGDLKAGVAVLLQNLKATPQLNGLIGKVLEQDPATGRWQVELGSHGVKALKASNLSPVLVASEGTEASAGARQAPACGGGVAGASSASAGAAAAPSASPSSSSRAAAAASSAPSPEAAKSDAAAIPLVDLSAERRAERPAPPAPLPEIKRLQVCLLGGEMALRGVGKTDVAAALLKGLTVEWPGKSDPVLEFVFEHGVFEKAWWELLREPADGEEVSEVARWGAGPVGAWSSASRTQFEAKSAAKVTPPFRADPAENYASMFPGFAAKLDFGPAKSVGVSRAKAFRELLSKGSTPDLGSLEALHRDVTKVAESRPRELVRKEQPISGVQATFARYSPEIGDLPGCGVAFLHILEESSRPCGSKHNAALLYVAAPSVRVHTGLTAGDFLCSLRALGSNVSRLVREYNRLVREEQPSAGSAKAECTRLQAEDLRAVVEQTVCEKSLAPGAWIELEFFRRDRQVMAGHLTEPELLHLLRQCKELETMVSEAASGKAFVRPVFDPSKLPPPPPPTEETKESEDAESAAKRKLEADGEDAEGDAKRPKPGDTLPGAKPVCRHWQQGYCSRGFDCCFPHIMLPHNLGNVVLPSAEKKKESTEEGEKDGEKAKEEVVEEEEENIEILPGSNVILHGLLKQPEFNHRKAICRYFDASTFRWEVELEDGTRMRVKEWNLVPC